MKAQKIVPAPSMNMPAQPAPKATPAAKMKKQPTVKAKQSPRGKAIKAGSSGAALSAPKGQPAKSKFKPVKSLDELKARAKKMGA